MASKKPEGSFEFLFGGNCREELSEAGQEARERLERDRVEAGERLVERAEARFREEKSPDSAYELGESYQDLIHIFAGRECLTKRIQVKRKLLGLLRWMTKAGIDIGDAAETLELLEIEFRYRQMEGGSDGTIREPVRS